MEEIALIEFINAREPGNVLRDIAERRLCDLKRNENRVDPPERLFHGRQQVKCYNLVTMRRYPNIRMAADDIHIEYSCLRTDIAKSKFKYNIVPV